MFWHCVNLWFAVMQKMFFNECTVVLFGHCNLLNSRQFSFINQVETVKSYKEQIKLTLFRDSMPSWIFNTNVVDISSAKVAAPCEWQIHTSQELTIFLLLRNTMLAIRSIFDSFHVWFVHSKKSRKLEAVFTFWQTKNHDRMQCQMSIVSKSENSETSIKQHANDWQSKRKLLERNLTKIVTPVYLSI